MNIDIEQGLGRARDHTPPATFDRRNRLVDGGAIATENQAPVLTVVPVAIQRFGIMRGVAFEPKPGFVARARRVAGNDRAGAAQRVMQEQDDRSLRIDRCRA
ncbi:MAG TPA: hypothetical protein PLI18_16745 [Pirellulaceae bacterium]|nr:hypothetical protein [Pirellulaceae bacterium]